MQPRHRHAIAMLFYPAARQGHYHCGFGWAAALQPSGFYHNQCHRCCYYYYYDYYFYNYHG